MAYDCNSCICLDKSKKYVHANSYTYGCRAEGRHKIVGDIVSDKELKTMGCSDHGNLRNEIEQLSMF